MGLITRYGIPEFSAANLYLGSVVDEQEKKEEFVP